MNMEFVRIESNMCLCLTPFILGTAIMAAITDSAIVEELVTLTMEERVGLDREDEWETIGKLAVYRTSDGKFSKLPEQT